MAKRKSQSSRDTPSEEENQESQEVQEETQTERDSESRTSASSPSSTKTSKKQSVESWARKHGTSRAIFAAAKVKHRWAEGRSLTEDEYQSAIKAASEEVIR